MSRAGRSNSGGLRSVWRQQFVMMEAVDDVSRSRVRGARVAAVGRGRGSVVKRRDGDGWDRGVRREMWEMDGTAWYGVLEPGCSDKVGTWESWAVGTGKLRRPRIPFLCTTRAGTT